MPIDSKAGYEKGSVGKMQIKGVTMTTSHGLPPPDTGHTELSEEDKCTYLNTGPIMNQEVVGGGKTQCSSDKATQSKTMKAKLHSKG